MEKSLKKIVPIIIMTFFIYSNFLDLIPIYSQMNSDYSGNTTVKNDKNEDNKIEVDSKDESNDSKKVKKKSSILILIGAIGGVVVVTAIFLILSKSYNIVGKWDLTETEGNETTAYWINFIGDKKSGTLTNQRNGNGNYKVSGKKVEFYFLDSQNTKYSGEFYEKNEMRGTIAYTSSTQTHYSTWTAIKNINNIGVK